MAGLARASAAVVVAIAVVLAVIQRNTSRFELPSHLLGHRAVFEENLIDQSTRNELLELMKQARRAFLRLGAATLYCLTQTPFTHR